MRRSGGERVVGVVLLNASKGTQLSVEGSKSQISLYSSVTKEAARLERRVGAKVCPDDTEPLRLGLGLLNSGGGGG